MTSAERQRRFLARLREQRPPPPEAAPKPMPMPMPTPAADLTIRLAHLKMDPARVARWVCQRLGPDAGRAIRDAFDEALADPSITSHEYVRDE
jgi:hypothetical protein